MFSTDSAKGMPMKKNRSPEFCIVGAGMSGLLMAIRLKKAGFNNIRVMEKAPAIGGTWYHNRYPGVACDVPAPYYSYSFALNPDWSQKYASGDEIYRYFNAVADRYQIKSLVECNTEILAARFDGSHWHIQTNNGETFAADFLISACGILHKSVYPEITGLENFSGKVMHSAQWDSAYPWQGKRIALIGNGSTGVQIIPHLAREAERLICFQRSAQWIMPVKNKYYGKLHKFLGKYLPGFKQLQYWSHRKTFENFTTLVLQDGWQRRITQKVSWATLNTVKDPELKAKLTPDYQPGCKRLVMSTEYYRAMQRSNVTLCTETISHLSEKSIHTINGQSHEVDLLVLATGFDPRAYMRPIELINEKGKHLNSVWQEKGIQAYRTVALPDFPNFFMVLGPNSPIGNFSVISAAENQTDYIIRCIKRKLALGCVSIAPSAQACEKYNKEIKEAMQSTIWVSGCKSWYLDEQGNSATWPWTPGKFRADLRKVNFDDFVFKEALNNPEYVIPAEAGISKNQQHRFPRSRE